MERLTSREILSKDVRRNHRFMLNIRCGDGIMIVILDYDMGNVGSIQNILNKIGQKDVLISLSLIHISEPTRL